jgi:hypothetical protein
MAQVTLTPSSTVTVSANSQVVEELDITGQVVVSGYTDVIIRKCRITHTGEHGIDFNNAAGLTIEDCKIIKTDVGNTSNLAVHGQNSANVTMTRVRVDRGGIYLLDCDTAVLSNIEGHDINMAFPRGQLVQFNSCLNPTLSDFSCINTPGQMWTEDNISVFQSPGATISNGHIDGNNSPTGVGIMFEQGSDNGSATDVDTIRMGNGSFSAFSADNITFLRCGHRENICTDQGRGAPTSGGQGWVFSNGANNGAVTDCSYWDICWTTHWISGTSDATIDLTEEDFTMQSPISLMFPWEDDETDIIVDNQDTNTSTVGTWGVSSGPNPFGPDSVFYDADANGVFTWDPELTAEASYEVFAWWTHHVNRSTTVPYDVVHTTGTDEVIVNQNDPALGGRWNSLGTFTLDENTTISVRSTNGQACADAVRLVPVVTVPPPPTDDHEERITALEAKLAAVKAIL